MFVIFENDWFSPSISVERGGGVVMTSGELYGKMDEAQYVPDEYETFLPSSARVVNLDDHVDAGEAPVPVDPETEAAGTFDKKAMQSQNAQHEKQQEQKKTMAVTKAKAAQKKAQALKANK